MEMLCRSSGSSMWPIRMSLPLCWIGGFLSSRLIFSSTLAPNHSDARMCPVTWTWLELPVRTSTLPDPVVNSRCTGPLTCKARWNEPSDAAAAGRARRQTKTATVRLATVQAESIKGTTFRRFMVLLNAYSKYASQEQVPDPGPLLQHYLIAFFEPTEELGLGAVRDSYVNRNLLLAVFRAGIGHFDRRLLVLVVDNRAFGDLEHTLVFFQNDFRVRGHLGL